MAHQVNLEYLSRVVFEEKDFLFPDSVVGTDSHITMVNGVGILGWGVGGIETEAVMLGLPVSLTLPEVVGCELTGSSNPFVTSIDVVLGITKHLRQVGVAGKFVEFFGSGVSQLSIVDRTTIANMCPEYGAILSFFPVDNVTLKHLEHTGIEEPPDKTVWEPVLYLKNKKHVIKINLNSIVPSVSGPKRPQDRVAVTDMKSDFRACLNEKVGFKGFQIAAEKQNDVVSIHYEGSEYKLAHGSVVIAAVISCTNNCNPSVMLAAGRLCDCVRANYLASPPLVVAYAIAGTVNIDFQTEPLGTDSTGKNIYLHDIWPSREEVHQIEEEHVVLSMFKALKEKIEMGNKRWSSLEAPDSVLFPWDLKSTYIRCPSFFDKLTKEPVALQPIENAHVLLYLGDSVTTDHISPAGSIARSSAAAKYLTNRGYVYMVIACFLVIDKVSLTPREFNSYGARRGNDAVMTRGTFANIKLFNKFIGKPAPKTVHFPSGQTLDVFEAAELYQKEGIPLIILAGKKYGSGNSRDWAAKGPYLLGVKAVLAESYEKIHKDHLIGIGIAPLQFLPGENADSLGLSGRETFSLTFPEELSPGVTLNIKTSTGKVFSVIASFENDVEITLYKHGGLLNFVARKFS
ncbi:Iron-responsive element-binding protein 2 [Camelus dromedarius]|nr:Iron-responsive element-binding protein 2 [Camelus dromedarius]